MFFFDSFEQGTKVDLSYYTVIGIFNFVVTVDGHIDDLKSRKHDSIFFHNNFMMVNSLILRRDAKLNLKRGSRF